MDTRQKIISVGELPARLANTRCQAIAGFFDPLTLAQAERIAAAGDNVLAIVDPGQDTLLDVGARATLVAALRSVKLVVIASRKEWEPVLAKSPHVQVNVDESAERARSEAFADFILQRQSS